MKSGHADEAFAIEATHHEMLICALKHWQDQLTLQSVVILDRGSERNGCVDERFAPQSHEGFGVRGQQGANHVHGLQWSWRTLNVYAAKLSMPHICLRCHNQYAVQSWMN